MMAAVEPKTDRDPYCWKCKRKLADLATRPWSIPCPHCFAKNRSLGPGLQIANKRV